MGELIKGWDKFFPTGLDGFFPVFLIKQYGIRFDSFLARSFMRKPLSPTLSPARLIAIAFTTLLISAVVIHQLYFARPVAAAVSVFINEIHYDNTGTYAGEAIEIAGPA